MAQRNRTRRTLLRASLSLAMPPIRRAAAAPQNITFAAQGGLFRDLYVPAVVEPFEQASAIGVQYYALASSAQGLALLRNGNVSGFDVVLLDVAASCTAAAEGWLEPLAALPVLDELAPQCVFPGLAGPALFSEPLVLLFDAAHVRPPANWQTLWSGTLPGSLAVTAPPDASGIAFTVVAARLFGDSNEMRALDDGVTAISDLARQVATWAPLPDVYRYVGEGNARLGVGWNLPSQIWSDRLRGRLGVAFPGEGTVSRVSTVNLVKGSRQPEAATRFITWLLGAEAQRRMVDTMFLGPVNAHTKYSHSALLRTANTPERAAHAMPVDWVTVAAMRETIIRRWRELVPDAI